MPTTSITQTEYLSLDAAYQFFNSHLFGGILPTCMLTLNRHPNARGYFSANRFNHREQQEQHTDEIALNPDNFLQRTDIEILSTLVHEQVHLWQHHFGKVSANRYHNKEWANKMENIGLMPSATGQPGGKRTGSKVTHYILPNGLFEQVAQQLLSSGFKISWQSPVGLRKEAPQSKVKYSCASCGQNAWAKPEAHLVCGDCEQALEAHN